MHPFRTTLPSFEPNFKLDHHQKVLCLGSCFAQHMAQKLHAYKFDCSANPYGILYHPLNIYNVIIQCLEGYTYSKQDLVQRDGYHYSWWHHSQCHHQQAEALLDALHLIQADLLQKIKSSKIFIFTFGTAYLYQHVQSNIPVGNCHKIAAKEFIKEMSDADMIASQYEKLQQEILVINPEAKFIYTVSPVRHIKDGIIENTRSKATLHLAIATIKNKMSQSTYFPAYEIMMDDLRDYRFYKSDLLHPSDMAIDYIWEQFSANLFTEQTKHTNKQIKTILDAVAHRPFKVESRAHQTFLKHTLQKMEKIQDEHSFLNFVSEIENLNSQII